MRETTPARTSHGGEFDSPPVSSAMPPCFDRWGKKFNDLLRTKAQKAVRGERGFMTKQLNVVDHKSNYLKPLFHPR